MASPATLRPCGDDEVPAILAIINDAAQAYRGIIPDDCWHDPYMTREALQAEIADGVTFLGAARQGALRGVMGLQRVQNAALIRHAYVARADQGTGLGRALLDRITRMTDLALLVGTWSAAHWAIAFYEHSGFQLVSPARKHTLLQRHWKVSARQRACSVVLEQTAQP